MCGRTALVVRQTVRDACRWLQVQAEVRSHVSRWKDGRQLHVQSSTRISVFVSVDQPAADTDVLDEVGTADAGAAAPSAAGQQSDEGEGQLQGRVDEQPTPELPLLLLHAADNDQ